MVSTAADNVLKHIEEMVERRYLPIIGPVRGRILVDVIRRFKPKRVLEVGTCVGYSTILMGKELETDSEIITIEIDEKTAEVAKENICKAKIKPNVTVLTGDALDLIGSLEGEFDVVFLDADKGEYYNYLRLVENKLHRGSVLVADNVGSSSSSMRD